MNSIIRSITLIAIFFLPISAKAQLVQYSIGTSGNEAATNVCFLPSDGSSIISGYTYDIVSGSVTNCQAFVIKVTSTGTIAWQKKFGMAGDDVIQDMIITQDGNILIAAIIGRTGVYSANKAGLLKFNSTTGALMWQNCLQANPANAGGEIFYGVTEMNDGRIVAVGSTNMGTSAGSPDGLICVFSSAGVLAYTERYSRGNTDILLSATKTAVGNSVYICGYFVGSAYHDAHIMKYTPGTTSGVFNWDKSYDFSINGDLQNNFANKIYERGSKLVIHGTSLHNYSTASGAGHYVLTLNASDGGSPQLRSIKNSGLLYSNDPHIFPTTDDHLYCVQSPSTSFYDAMVPTTGVTTNSVITEVTSLTGKTANAPVKITLPYVGQKTMFDIKQTGSLLHMAGTTNITAGFGGNDIYYLATDLSLGGSTGSCDTVHDIVSIRDTFVTAGAFTWTSSTLAVSYVTPTVTDASFNIQVLCGTAPPVAAVCDSISMPDSLHLCMGDTATMPATLVGTNPVYSYLWSPPTGLSSTTILNPLLTATSSGWYTLTAKSILPGNLVVNGDFTAGNTGFSSSYTYSAPPSSILFEGFYSVYTNPFGVHTGFTSMGDHTTGTGNMMIINGAGSPVDVWCQTIAVTPNTDYDFSAWFANCSSITVGAYVPIIQFKINGVLIGTPMTVSAAPGTWVNYSSIWNSGTSTSATICIYDGLTTTTGNDFAIDDISFKEVCSVKDSIYVAVGLPVSTTSSRDTTVCGPTAPITFTATGGAGSYVWSDGTTGATHTASSSGALWVRGTAACAQHTDTFHLTVLPTPVINLGNDTALCLPDSLVITSVQPAGYAYLWSTGSTANNIHITATGTYWLRVSNGICSATDTIHTDIVLPESTTSSQDTVVCGPGVSIPLVATGGYTTYLWSDGTTGATKTVSASGTYWVKGTLGCAQNTDTFHVTVVPTPVVNLGNDTAFCIGESLTLSSPQPAGSIYLWSTGSGATTISASSTGTYWLRVTNNICTATDTIHIVVAPHPVVDLGPDTAQCEGMPVTLQSSITYTGATYLWSNFSVAPSTVATTTNTYWLRVTVDGCSGYDTVNVTIAYDTFTLHTTDTAICRGMSLPVFVTGNPAISFVWTPTTGISDPFTPTPVILTDTSATYIVKASLAGCPPKYDSFHLDVQPVPLVYIGGNRSVCEFDTLHIHAYVNPAWYTHYHYSWTPGANLDTGGISTVVFQSDALKTVIVTVTTPRGCKGIDSAQVTVYPNDFATLDTVVHLCPHDSAQLKPRSTDASTVYRWHPAMYLNDTMLAQPIVKPATSQNYYAIATSQYGCLDTVHAQVVVHPGGAIYLGDSVVLYPGESFQLNPQTNCTRFLWFPPAGLNSPFISNPLATPLVNTKYVVNAWTEWNCMVSDSINIRVSFETIIDLPNAFSPGGSNKTFKILKRGLATINYFRIYNRWGNVIYDSKDIDAGWDGTYKGVPQPFDVYVYQVEAVTESGVVIHKAGNVTLLR